MWSRVPVNNETLWDHVYDSFRRQYADMQERERAEDTLQQGISMKQGDLDTYIVKKQPSQDVLHGDAAEEELGLACLVSSYTLLHQNSQPGRRGQQTARSKVLSRHARDT